ncbi:DoxX family protein [Nonomuraea soli]|uniref:Putative oxidoreductase n=1 Tax=Nonomuraea soli TaxID=1032476 RepID=A0A7W0CJ95_9ACTN|nr:DoxX family protein [Nonomuraea soli]MBA2892170.1 putative oxidoreductase [Nonomuraea soli]
MGKIVYDLGALIARVTIGVIFIAHGWQKWQNGLDATTQMFVQAGVPMPQAAATFTAVAELGGGSLLVLGLITRIVALALLAVSIGAIAYVHIYNGIFVADNGWELVGALGAGCLLLMVAGPGRISLDGLFGGVMRRNKERKEAYKVATAPGTTAPVTTTVTTGQAAPPVAQREVPSQRLTQDELTEIDALVAEDPPTPRSSSQSAPPSAPRSAPPSTPPSGPQSGPPPAPPSSARQDPPEPPAGP